MKKKKIGLIVTTILLVGLVCIGYTYSKLNITYRYDLSFSSKSYTPLTVTNTTQLGDNSYQISLNNTNSYDIEFSCEDINSKFDITCNENTIPANSNKNIEVNLDFKSGVDTSTLTPNPNGNGYITKIGIRITRPYSYPTSDPHYVESDNMIVIEVVVNNLVEHITNLASSDTTNLANDHGNIRYIGATPKNYVSFNNELWRIIGVVDGKVKIISTKLYNNTPYTFYDGSSSGTNTNFANAQIKKDLNDTFYYTLNQNSRSLVKEGTWNVGGFSSYWDNAETSYNTEKASTLKQMSD